MTDQFYNSKAWKKLAYRTRFRAVAERKACPVCKKPIMPGQLLIVDHTIPRRQRPDLALDEKNLRVLHHACHSKKTRWVDYGDKPALDESGYPDGWR